MARQTNSAEKIDKASLKYINSEKGKETNQKYAKSEEGKRTRREYYNSDRGREVQLRYYYSEKSIKNRLQRLELSKLTTRYIHFQKENPEASFNDFLKVNTI